MFIDILNIKPSNSDRQHLLTLFIIGILFLLVMLSIIHCYFRIKISHFLDASGNKNIINLNSLDELNSKLVNILKSDNVTQLKEQIDCNLLLTNRLYYRPFILRINFRKH